MTTHIPLTAENIDIFLKESKVREGRGHKFWADFVTHTKFVVENPSTADPTSSDFRAYQLELWKLISTRSNYDALSCESNNNIQSEPSIQQTYPFTSRSPKEVGSYFLGVANIVQKMPVPVGARVVEFGVGYGHLTRMLSNLGYQVDAVDIESRFLQLLPALSLPGAEKIALHSSSFVDVFFQKETIDAFVFYECFHHCLDHGKLISKMYDALRSGGAIMFAAEAFYDDWFDFPWGVRTDGHSVWAIRNFGWMELGFRKSFISSVLSQQGFELEWSSLNEAGSYGELLIARKA